jgi:DNA processing protein
MAAPPDTAALVALLRSGKRAWNTYAALLEEAGSATPVLQEEQGLLLDDLLADAAADLAKWKALGIRVMSVLDPGYPQNLRAVHDRPPLIFVSGELEPTDAKSVAVIGSRRASREGLARARTVAELLVADGYTVNSGLAAGIDTAAHTAALDAGGRTLAVLGTGLMHAYPPQNAGLQQRIAERCAVISRFWPDAPPTRKSFPVRNAVTSGISLATVIVEASETSGARIQARCSLSQGRPVILTKPLLQQAWARELADRPGTHVASSAPEVIEVIERITAPGTLVV